MRSALADEIVSPTGADIIALRALAFAEIYVANGTAADVHNVVKANVHRRLVEVYAPVADRNYRQVARHFSDLVVSFGKCANICDVDAASDSVIGADDKTRQAWLAAEGLARELDANLPVLHHAALLAGAVQTGEDRQLQIPLVVANLDKLHKRRVYEAWESGGRCGRWSALHRLGAKIDAASKPERVETYSEPAPYAVTFEQNLSTGSYERVVRDPEDDPKAVVPDVEWSAA